MGFLLLFPRLLPFIFTKPFKNCLELAHVLSFRDEECHLCPVWILTHHYLVRNLKKKLPSKKETLTLIKTFEFNWTEWPLFPRYAHFCIQHFGANSSVLFRQVQRLWWGLCIILGGDASWLMHFKHSFKSPSVVLNVQFAMPMNNSSFIKSQSVCSDRNTT